jgi:acyl-CoA reductase-like NAD-dependent aldehyde dehydrogenase
MMDSTEKASIDWVARADALKPQVRNLVGGQSVSAGGSEAVSKLSPRDGRLLCQFGAGTQQDVDSAVTVARRAFADGRWSKLSVQRRAEALNALAGLLAANMEEFALLESLDTGKPISDALKFDVPHAVAALRAAAAAGDKLAGQIYGVDATSLSYQ